jgi:hypothetical protein
MRRLIVAALLAATACGPRVLPQVQRNPYAFSSPADSEAAWVAIIAEGLQLNPATDPATRADPFPCARATYAAQHNHTPLPRCYYVPTGLSAVGWVP